ncbi:MAG TPA: FAD-dependent oxidoreductase [Burkholderiales bacterium]|nr:FAD-dependent oxidoreductase [Burkholderiales bacterium]
MLPATTDVLIAGGGPCGLVLAIELGRRGIAVVLVDQDAGTTRNAAANATQARTMEHFRRLGFANEIRALGLPPEFPTDIAYFTRFARHELARFALPSSRDARQLVATLSGSWSAAELPHRCNQKFIEPVLRRHAEALPGVSVNYGWRLAHFEQFHDRVEARVESSYQNQAITARYLVGADGARSTVRHALGVPYAGETGVARHFVGGRMYAVHARIPEFYREVAHRPAWMNVAFNPERRCFMPAVDGKSEFAFHTQLGSNENETSVTDAEAIAMVQQVIGLPLRVEVIARAAWTAGHSLVAEKFASGRVYLGGDAAHLFTPTGGLGYNTAVEDAVNLGWKIAAVLKGWAAPMLLESYEAERRPLAVRNTGYAKGFADSLGNYVPAPEIEDDTRAGAAARRRASEHFAAHGRAEFDIPGITFGGRYDGSLAIVSDGTAPPPDKANEYIPTACPGGRAPHLWMPDGRSLYDLFGFEWTLLRLGKRKSSMPPRSPMLEVLDLDSEEARELYAADFVLMRPDQIVAWRSNSDAGLEIIMRKLCGFFPGVPDTANLA